MPFTFDLSEHLRETVKKLSKHDPRRCEIIYKKIKEIIESNEITINHYKNLRYSEPTKRVGSNYPEPTEVNSGFANRKNLVGSVYDLSDYKRVNIDKSFVLIFKVFRKENHILFERFEHHDRIYRK